MKTLSKLIKRTSFWARTFVFKKEDVVFYKLTIISFPYESCNLLGKIDFSNE